MASSSKKSVMHSVNSAPIRNYAAYGLPIAGLPYRKDFAP
jgi:hypothetical protein